MSGNRYFLDTNAIIYLLQNESSNLLNLLNSSSWVGISIISQIEFLSFSKLSKDDKHLFNSFVQHVEVIEVLSSNIRLIDDIIKLRKNYSIKLPDAMIVGSAIYSNSVLISNDNELYKIKEVVVQNAE
jgi:tRNA(fMet)-specific endonuclease VapC